MNGKLSNSQAVWIIDDDQSIRWVLQRALQNTGFTVSVFETASTALSQFKRTEVDSRPSLILSDFRMPGINGFELLKQIKHIDPLLPVIIMTAYADLDTTAQAYQEGAFEYLAKPFDIDDAINLVKKAYQQQRNARHDQEKLSQATAYPKQAESDTLQFENSTDWQTALQCWASEALATGKSDILTEAVVEFEKVLIDCALSASKGRKQEAAKLLGWGRNTLTRKLKQYR
ncbi:MAG: response regulator [Gammaproteobacteria bacterium]|nr:response regulator [Gammaproteobacteria bacterium]